MHGWLEPSNKADRTRGPIIVGNMRFMLNLNAQGRPYLLKWYVRNRVGRWRWSICWAEWHKGKPIGIRRRAIAAMGFVWQTDTEAEPGHWQAVPLANPVPEQKA